MPEPFIDMSRECLDDELIAAFIDGRLVRKQTQFVADHLARCGTCCELFAETVRMQATEADLSDVSHTQAEHDEPLRPILWFDMKRFMLPTAAALLTAASILFSAGPNMRLRLWPNAPQSELADLVTAVGTERAIEARLTGGFKYGPEPSPSRGPSTPEAALNVQVATTRIEQAAAADQSPEMQAALGVAFLVRGNINRAVAILERVACQRPQNPQFQSDLSAAYLARAARSNDADDSVKALFAAERAIETQPGLREASFNRALALESLHRTEEARRAWREYLDRDGDSNWANDARHHLQALEAGFKQSRMEKDGICRDERLF